MPPGSPRDKRVPTADDPVGPVRASGAPQSRSDAQSGARAEARTQSACDSVSVSELAERIRAHEWASSVQQLEAEGWALVPGLLTLSWCRQLASCWLSPESFRNHIVMQQHGYGRGEYRYFAYPLPPSIALLRESLYAQLAPIANRWAAALRLEARFPADHATFLEACHAAGQERPTPLLLTYGPGDFNRLHQDVYGDHMFPLQVAVLLSEPDQDFTGGEFVITEQRPRMQSKPTVIPLSQGDAVIFAVHQRPGMGPRGVHRITVRHGVSPLRSGERRTLGVIFHDAR